MLSFGPFPIAHPLWPLLGGVLLDLLLGDPNLPFHPVRIMGSSIGFLERALNRGEGRFVKGLLVTLIAVGGTALLFYGAVRVLAPYPTASLLFRTLSVYFFLAGRSLISEAARVEAALPDSLAEARNLLSRIVGRDTDSLDLQGIRRALLETLSENLSDGFTAPFLFYVVGGVPAMAVYKMINTLDSMIGYKSERYMQFGKSAARLDDAANWIPSRLTSFGMVLVSGRWGAFSVILRYGRAHTSPNAGYPEAALAGILGCRLGGPSYYGGNRVEKPWIGDGNRILEKRDVKQAAGINLRAIFFWVATGVLYYSVPFLF